jgi:RNA polymerase sigma factor (sigma-70 family)
MSVDNPAVDPEELLAHAAWLQRLAARLVEPSAVEDLLQDTYVAALERPGAVVRSPRPWLAGVLRNLVRNRARVAGRWAAQQRRLGAEPAGALPNAEQLLTQHEALRLVAELVSALEEPFRSTVLLCYGRGLAPAEVARKRGIPPGTVRWRLKRGLDDLRAALDQRHGNDRRAWCVALASLAAAAVPVGAALPVAGALKLAAGVAAAAALGLWLGTWPAWQPAGSTPAPDSTGPVTQVGDPRTQPPRFAAAGAAQPGPGAGPQTARTAASPAQTDPRPAVIGVSAPAGKPLSVEMQNAMKVGNAPSLGDPKARVTVVMFIDFEDRFSARAQDTMAQLLAANPSDIRLVARNLPRPSHGYAKVAAEAALAAHEQGKFWAMHDRLFANQQALDPTALEEHARAIGLDVSRVRQALEDKRFLATVAEDQRVAAEAGVLGPPTFLINGSMIYGAWPLSRFQEAVDQALGRPKPPKLPPQPCDPAALGPAPSDTKRGMPADPVALARAAVPGHAPSKGEPGAPVTIVLFNDYHCAFCGQNAPVMEQLLAVYPKQLRLVWKNLPSHKQAPLAAEAALAAHEQGRFEAMHDRLLANQDALGPGALEEHAAQVGLDLDRFRAAMKERRFRPAVERDVRDARAAGIQATPTALINGRKLSGAWPIDTLKSSIDRELDRARGLPVDDEPLDAPRPLLDWPPPRLTIPDELLGERLAIALPTGDAPATGSARAPVEVLYIFSNDEYPIGWGKRMVDHLRQAYGENLRIIARPVPGPDSSPEAQLVAEAAWAAHEQGKFWQMNDKLSVQGGERNRATVERDAAEIGLHLADFRTALDEGRYRNLIAADAELLGQAGLTGRPLFVVNGRRAGGRIALVQLVETALLKAGIKVPRLPETQPGRFRPPEDVSTAQWFHFDKRDQSWAPAVERELARIVEPDLRSVDPAIKAVEVACKSVVCRLLFRAGEQRHAANFARQVYGAKLWRPAAGAVDHAYLILRDGPDRRMTAEETVTSLRTRRSGLIFSLRTGRLQPDADLPLARLPRS